MRRHLSQLRRLLTIQISTTLDYAQFYFYAEPISGVIAAAPQQLPFLQRHLQQQKYQHFPFTYFYQLPQLQCQYQFNHHNYPSYSSYTSQLQSPPSISVPTIQPLKPHPLGKPYYDNYHSLYRSDRNDHGFLERSNYTGLADRSTRRNYYLYQQFKPLRTSFRADRYYSSVDSYAGFDHFSPGAAPKTPLLPTSVQDHSYSNLSLNTTPKTLHSLPLQNFEDDFETLPPFQSGSCYKYQPLLSDPDDCDFDYDVRESVHTGAYVYRRRTARTRRGGGYQRSSPKKLLPHLLPSGNTSCEESSGGEWSFKPAFRDETWGGEISSSCTAPSEPLNFFPKKELYWPERSSPQNYSFKLPRHQVVQQHQQFEVYPFLQQEKQQTHYRQEPQSEQYGFYPNYVNDNFNHITLRSTTWLGEKRMMVSKIWSNCFPKFTPEHVHRHNFYLCQWQRNTQVRIVYLFYRWLTAITCLAALVCSLLDIGRTEEHFENHYAKWWIYLTHWGLLFCTVQAWLAAWIVTQGMMVEREDFEIVRQARKSRLHHIYWVLYTCATVYSFIITMCYWFLVHNPEIHKIDALNIMVHVFNSVIMLIDLAIVGHPIKLSHAYFTTGIGLAYAIFTGVYFLAGGTDRKNQTYIYPMLDWTKPGKAIIVTVCAIIFVFITHFCCYLLYRVRVWLFTKLCIRSSYSRGGEMSEDLNDDSCSRLGGATSQDYSHQQQYPIAYTEQPQRLAAVKSSNNPYQATSTTSNPPRDSMHISQAPQYHPQYSGYQQQPVVAGVNVGVVSADGYEQLDSKQRHTRDGQSSSLNRTFSHLDDVQREQFLNADRIVEYKM